MSWNAAHAQARRAALAPLDDEFRKLPAPLREQGRLFRANLLAGIPSGELADVFSGPHDHPGLYLHYWVLESLPTDPSPISPAALTRAAFYTAAAVRLSGQIADPASLVTESALSLLAHFRGRAVDILAGLHGEEAVFRESIRTAWSRFDDGTDLLASLKLPALSAWGAGGRESDLQRLDVFLELLNGVYRFLLAARSLRRDLQIGCQGDLVRGLLDAAGIRGDEPGWAEHLMGAVLLTDVLNVPIRDAQADLAAARTAATELGLSGFTSYLEYLAASLDRIRRLFGPERGGEAMKAASGDGFLRPAIDIDQVAHTSAEAFLISDLNFEESWEVHRYRLFKRQVVISRFPAGLVLELLCDTGHRLTETVDGYLTHLASRRFGYFDDPEIVLRDSDTLGLALRLWRYSSRQDVRADVEWKGALNLLERVVGADGRIPVWLEPPPSGVRLAGEGCGVVEAHLLLGLLAFDAVRFEPLIARSSARLLARFEALGAGISINYPALYALDVIRRLAGALFAAGLWEFEPKWSGIYRSVLQAELTHPPKSPQQAAFALMACTSFAEDMRAIGWRALIYKGQRSDGSWNAEPFCFIANRGNEASWYSSRTLTTAFCYQALQTAQLVRFDRKEAPEEAIEAID